MLSSLLAPEPPDEGSLGTWHPGQSQSFEEGSERFFRKLREEGVLVCGRTGVMRAERKSLQLRPGAGEGASGRGTLRLGPGGGGAVSQWGEEREL